MIRLEHRDEDYAVYLDGQPIGTVRLYENPCHMQNCYVKLNLELLDTEISAELFRKMQEITKRPLQVMVSSEDTALTQFLTAGGFECRRRCYEVEAGTEDYVGGIDQVPLFHSRAGEPEYAQCCRMMFDHYAQTHREVNPWTAGYETFCRELPADVIYAMANGEIASLAFVEDNEIAYVCGRDRQHFGAFARGLAAAMLEKYESVCFESDDCDWAAMQLRSMFANPDETSFDTYVYDHERTVS